MNSKRMNGSLNRDLLTLDDESNPSTSKVNKIYPSTVLDQVFDDQSPTHKTLREIIEELHHDIITGGKGNIVFPVTSVNKQDGDVIIDKVSVGLDKVDNTPDSKKPLSTPQYSAIMEILNNHDFNIDIEEICHHILNEHLKDITDQIIKDAWGNELPTIKDEGSTTGNTTLFYRNLRALISNMISKHNYSTEISTHVDIRRSLSRLWNQVDEINNGLEDRVGKVLDCMNQHLEDPLAHSDIFDEKEDISNKVSEFSTEVDNDYTKYPSTKAVVNFVNNAIDEYSKILPDIKEWVTDIGVVDNRDSLPPANSKSYRSLYFIRNGLTSNCEIALCRINPDNKTYSWDISTLGSYSKFNANHFVDTVDGLSINMPSVVDAILDENGALDTSLSQILSHYYKKDEVNALDNENIKKLMMLPGTQDGTFRFYRNDDVSTMSDDVHIAGLQRLAYLEWITEDQLFDQSVHERHIISNAIATKHIQNNAVTPVKMSCEYGHILGNTNNADNSNVNEISLVDLADYLRPLIGGWPDPNTPGGNPYSAIIDSVVMHPHLWDNGADHVLADNSHAIRFTGTISVLPNVDISIKLSSDINLTNSKLMDAGGSWQYECDPEEWTILGGSNITGHTFGTIVMKNDGLYFDSISIGNRIDAKYDIWVKFTNNEEMKQLYGK